MASTDPALTIQKRLIFNSCEERMIATGRKGRALDNAAIDFLAGAATCANSPLKAWLNTWLALVVATRGWRAAYAQWQEANPPEPEYNLQATGGEPIAKTLAGE